jgi:hypothetical protein
MTHYSRHRLRQMTVIAVALAARILDAGGEVVITREEYERVCQSNIDRDRDIMVHVEADTMTMRYSRSASMIPSPSAKSMRW